MYIGHAILGRYAFPYFDPAIYDWEDIFTAILAFNFLPNFFFAVVYGLTGFREMATKRTETTSSGYSRLPQ
ncbi:hypothetical protein BP6252_01261 [Coleophoma cylindrospora]|uniref:Uncharacterized protein n=1 Tax=Coleophoma cylindrospora TaxID=1849047 RepID=A0A3D8SSC9_9HELO|nr:hypothetical protein BP6252_01261 [Coleophoma cylindrospora]